MKTVFYLLAALCLLGARGCPSERPPSRGAILLVDSASKGPIESSSREGDQQVAVAKVMAHAHNPRFQAAVAESLRISPEALNRVILERRRESRFVEVRAELAEEELAANVANAVARRLAEDFRNNPDLVVRVIDYANPPKPARD